MLLAACDAQSCVEDFDESSFLVSRLYQSAPVRSLESLARQQAKFQHQHELFILKFLGARSMECTTG